MAGLLIIHPWVDTTGSVEQSGNRSQGARLLEYNLTSVYTKIEGTYIPSTRLPG